MRARVKQTHRWDLVQAFGLRFNKIDWGRVPVGREEEARLNPYLEIEEPQEPDVPAAEPQEKTEAPKSQPGKRTNTAQGKARGAK